VHSRIVTCAVAVLLLSRAVLAQSAFEVASVKRNTTGNSARFITYTADSLQATNVTLSALIQSAYGINGILWEDRLVGGPSWVRTTRFDVNAKAAQALPREQLRLMAQRLLENRFGVVLTRERREQEVYALRRARSDGRTGPDLHRAPDDCLRSPADRPIPKSSIGAAPTTHGRCTTIRLLATGLSRTLGVEVVDQTGLPGQWDFVLAFTELSADASPRQTNLPTVFVALEEQLGLKLERNARGSVEYVIIAAAHAPTEN
jgi:uncharacterized protein (TIGR03435 family)